MMRYDFTLILEDPPPESPESWLADLAEALYARFRGDITPAVINGHVELGCTIETSMMDAALREARDAVRALGLRIRCIEIAPDAIPESL